MFGLLSRLWRRKHQVVRTSELPDLPGKRVEFEGYADPVVPLVDPVTGDACAAIEYRAWPPSTTIGIDGGTGHNGRAYQINARQASDFSSTDGAITVLIVVDGGQDVVALHRQLLEQFGVGLRAETDVVPIGARVRVVGRVDPTPHAGSPHRSAPHVVTVRAERFWLIQS